ncbi:replicative DNA helicase [Streptacidiphilus cavernicola]|uniref:DNA 5'-3' helicase n=1 Tax=Streptacidiphilus cavernicola TaxID=3342716 RepID=A0ABV6VXQ8_9ACTN
MNDYDEPPDSADEPLADLLAEQTVIGAMLLSSRVVDQVAPVLGEGEAFHRRAHELIYQAILRLHDAPGTTANAITVERALRRTGDLVRCGGPSYLHTCVSAVPTASVGIDCADTVADLYNLRKLQQLGQQLAARARMRDTPADEIASLALSELQGLFADTAGGKQELLSVADRWPGYVDELEKHDDPRALDSPWPDLNAVVQFRPKELTVVGAATSGGKSLLALNLAAHVAFRRQQPVLVASIEMGGSELLSRLTSSEANLELDYLMRRNLDEPRWGKIARVNDRMMSPAAADFILDDSPSMTIAKIRSRVRWMASQDRKPAIVIVDYLQIVTPDSAHAGRGRTQEVASISLGLKGIADEFEVPVVALAQFNRSTVGRRPLVSDFKDSSQIEQDASTVLLLHRELDDEGNDTGPNAGKVLLVVAKNRNGRRGVEIWLNFQGKFAALRNLTAATPPPRAELEFPP